MTKLNVQKDLVNGTDPQAWMFVFYTNLIRYAWPLKFSM